jgi:hypothetical protein
VCVRGVCVVCVCVVCVCVFVVRLCVRGVCVHGVCVRVVCVCAWCLCVRGVCVCMYGPMHVNNVNKLIYNLFPLRFLAKRERSACQHHDSIQGFEVKVQSFLTSLPEGAEWLTLCLAALHPRKNLGAREMGGCLGLRTGLEVLENRNIPWPCRVTSSRLSVRSLVAMPTVLFRFPC